jgi:hypothetical protein
MTRSPTSPFRALEIRVNFVGVLSAGQAEVPGANGSKDARALGENSGNQHSGFISNDITPPA